MSNAPSEAERLRRWRLVLGGGHDVGDDGTGADLSGDDAGMDAVGLTDEMGFAGT